ncbi:mRNA capping enzyme family protein [Actinidia rufa]|uniref:mRNA capping enzyme family protein n=1 Tax=Actinidia rufa TaxID=165716 RepID=A0A7J0E7N6_9ERIC|nr:mRNA capping enzyme family protein [Actinidia rufa]
MILMSEKTKLTIEREERRQRLKRERPDDRPTEASQPPIYDKIYQKNYRNYDRNKLPPGTHFIALASGWLACPAFGQEIGCIIPSKVPLGESFNDHVPPGKRYSFKQVIHQQRVLGRKLGLVIDLTNTSRYYSALDWKKEGIKHVKIQCKGRDSVPDNEAVNYFAYEISQFLIRQKHSKKYVLVHCTHGHNRTGFMIVHYLMRTLSMSVTQAIKLFADARPPGIYKPDYIDALYKFYHERKPEMVVCPPTPEWKRTSDLDLNGVAVPDEDDDGVPVAPLPDTITAHTELKPTSLKDGYADVTRYSASALHLLQSITVLNIKACLPHAFAIRKERMHEGGMGGRGLWVAVGKGDGWAALRENMIESLAGSSGKWEGGVAWKRREGCVDWKTRGGGANLNCNMSLLFQENHEIDTVMTNDDVLGDSIPFDQQDAMRQFCYQALKLGIGVRGNSQFPGSHPVSLSRDNLQLLRQRYYYATWKADGTRYMMLITMDGCHLIDRNFNFRRVQMRFPCKGTNEALAEKAHHYTLLDGEMIIDTLPDSQKQERRYLIYDLMAINQVSVVERPFYERWKMLEKEVIEPRNYERQHIYQSRNPYYRYDLEPFRVRRKDFWLLSTVTKLLKEFIPRLSHAADGLIFQGWDDPYVPRTHEGLLKWKYPEMNSVDFLFEMVDDRQQLYLHERGKKKLMEGNRVIFNGYSLARPVVHLGAGGSIEVHPSTNL